MSDNWGHPSGDDQAAQPGNPELNLPSPPPAYPPPTYTSGRGYGPLPGPAPWYGPPATVAPRKRRGLHPAAFAAALILASGSIGVALGHELVKQQVPSASAPVALPSVLATPDGAPSDTAPADTAPSDTAPSDTAPSDGATGTGNSRGTPSDVAAIAENVDPGVVDIDTVVGYGSGRAAGTGMVISSDGLILTNNHVISGATKISVTDVGNGKTYAATVLGYDRTRDIAVLKLTHASGLRTVAIATAQVKVGALVVGVGNAGGVGGTPSYAGGVVTALNQPITAYDAADGTSERLTGLIQTNADIRPGDSGGPLVNEKGQVIGVDTAAGSANGTGRGNPAGFAVPIVKALQIAAQIEAGTSSATVHVGETGLLGVRVLRERTATSSGVVIGGVLSGGPAERAGLQAGDVIVSVGGHKVGAPGDLTAVMLGEKPGTRVSVTYRRGATEHTVSVQVVAGPPQ